MFSSFTKVLFCVLVLSFSFSAFAEERIVIEDREVKAYATEDPLWKHSIPEGISDNCADQALQKPDEEVVCSSELSVRGVPLKTVRHQWFTISSTLADRFETSLFFNKKDGFKTETKTITYQESTDWFLSIWMHGLPMLALVILAFNPPVIYLKQTGILLAGIMVGPAIGLLIGVFDAGVAAGVVGGLAGAFVVVFAGMLVGKFTRGFGLFTGVFAGVLAGVLGWKASDTSGFFVFLILTAVLGLVLSLIIEYFKKKEQIPAV